MTEMSEFDKKRMKEAVETMREICTKNKTCLGCPFIFCEDEDFTQPMTWVFPKNKNQEEK